MLDNTTANATDLDPLPKSQRTYSMTVRLLKDHSRRISIPEFETSSKEINCKKSWRPRQVPHSADETRVTEAGLEDAIEKRLDPPSFVLNVWYGDGPLI
jgi:hypothetical protein